MDRHLILTPKEGHTAQELLSYVNLLAAGYWKQEGYTVANGGVIGRCKGIDNPSAVKTTTWAEIQTSPDGTEYFSSLSNDARFCDWKDYWSQAGLPDCYEESEMPDEWIVEEEL